MKIPHRERVEELACLILDAYICLSVIVLLAGVQVDELLRKEQK
jgi:hypothetical protein